MVHYDRQFVDALARGLAILEFLSRAPRPQSNGEIAKTTGLAPSTVSRLTHTLTMLGYTRQSEGIRAYELTPKNLSLGYPILANMTLIDRARPHLKQLSETTGESATLAIRDGLHITFVDVVHGTSIVAVRLAMGARLPIAASAGGIALLASMPERERRTLASRVRTFINKQQGDLESFDRGLAQASADGFAVMRDVWRPGVGGVSVALKSDNELATLTIPVATGSVSERTMRDTFAKDLLAAAEKLTTPIQL